MRKEKEYEGARPAELDAHFAALFETSLFSR